MSDLDAAISGRKKRRKPEVVITETPAEVPATTTEVTQEVTETPVIVVQEVVAKRPERQPTPRTLAEMERGRRAIAEVAALRAAVKK